MIEVANIIGDEYSCFCPFHKDSNPSLQVNVKKNKAICFAGCYRGSASKMIAKALSLPTIVAWQSMQDGTWCHISTEAFANYQSSTGQAFPVVPPVKWVPGDRTPYLLKRGFTRSTIAFWGVEYSDEIKHIRFPIFAADGTLLSYSYRTTADVEPKYIHPGFPKKEGYLYGQFQARPDKFISYYVEGALDAMWLWQFGYVNAYAFLGGPTEEQIAKIPSLGAVNKICTDGDDGGRSHAQSVIKGLTKLGIGFSVIQFPEGKDPQDMSGDDLRLLLK